MKSKLIYLSIPALIAVAGLFFLSNTERKEQPFALSMTSSIDVPKQVDFAGETLKLDRYDLYERYDREINGFTYLHSTTLLYIKKANRYFPIIEPILKQYGIPDDFKYLAVIESSLNHRAVSPAGAAGLWQFMKATGSEYGLLITSEVDERYSIEKSTVAACKYFLDAYAKYGSWADVALSYNAGQGRISTEKEKQMVSSGLDLLLVDETSRYYFRMLAIKEIMENPYKYGFVINPDQLYKQIEFDTVEVNESISDLAAFAIEKGITYAQLKDFNSWLRDRKLTVAEKSNKSYNILIPTQESIYYQNRKKADVHDKRWISHD